MGRALTSRRRGRGGLSIVAAVMAAGAVLAAAIGPPEVQDGAPFVRDLWTQTPYFIGSFQALLSQASPWSRGLCALLLWRRWRLGVPLALAWTGVEVLGAVLLFRDRTRLLWGYGPAVSALWDASPSPLLLLTFQAVLWLGCAWILGRHWLLHGSLRLESRRPD
jgi:hypothetical protein